MEAFSNRSIDIMVVKETSKSSVILLHMTDAKIRPIMQMENQLQAIHKHKKSGDTTWYLPRLF